MTRLTLIIPALVALVIVGAAGSSWAINEDGAFNIIGSGNDSCGTWTKLRKSGGWQQMADWSAGFITATNLHTKNGLGLPAENGDAITSWLDSYCQENPFSTWVNANNELLRNYPH